MNISMYHIQLMMIQHWPGWESSLTLVANSPGSSAPRVCSKIVTNGIALINQ